MKLNKKGALSDELILFLVATFILMILMVALHLIVTVNSSEDEDSEAGKYRSKSLDIGGYFFVEDFLNYRVNSSLKQKYSKLIDKEIGENISVEHMLTSPSKNRAEEFFHEIKDVYLDENGERLNNYFRFADLGENVEVNSLDDYIIYTHFNYEDITIKRKNIENGCDIFANFFRSDSSKVLPIRSKKLDEEVILFSVEPIFSNCLSLKNDEEVYIR